MATIKLEKPLESNIGADVNANVVTENRVEAVDADTVLDCVNEGIGHPSTMNANVESVLATSTGTTCNVCTGLANKPILTSTLIPTSSASNPEYVSFATLLRGDTSHKSINFCTLITSAGIGADVVVSKESVCVVNERLNNMVYEFFLGKHVAYLVVENYFSFKDMMKSMLENGSWLIHNVPLILRKWTPNANIMMEEVCNIGRVPRGGIEEDQVTRLRNSLTNVILSQSLDRWVWNLESSGDFSVKSARSFIDDTLLPKTDVPTRWQSCHHQRLPTRSYILILSHGDFWVFNAKLEAPEEAMQSPEQAPTSPDYVPGPEHPPSPDYVPGPKYPEYLVPSNDEVPIKDQVLLADASPTALSSGYVVDSDPSEEDPEEDTEEDHVEYPADGGDDDDEEEESSDDDDDDEDEASEEEEDEEEEHLAPPDSAALPAIDLVPSAEDTEAFETDKSAPTPPPPRSPWTKVPFSQTRLRRARKTVRPQPPMTASAEALIAEYASAPTPPSPPPSPLSPWSSPLPQIPSPPLPLPSLPTHT
ncbi:hypothetical protein Tco_0809332, partial [Tanacetum coccineum]